MELTAAGFTQDTPTQIRTDVTNEALASVAGFTSFPTELRTNLIDELVIYEMHFQDMISALANGIGPDFANDQQFKQFGSSLGLTMKDFQYAQATVRFTGTVGTIIPVNTRVSNGGTTVLYVKAQSIVGSTGTIDVLCESKQQIIVDIPANTITTLVDVLPSITSVNNPTAGTSGITAETLEQYKTAIYNEIQQPRYGTTARARSLLRAISGVEDRLIYFRTMQLPKVVGGNTVYYQGIECVVGGGADYDVANALFTAFLQTKNLLSNPSNSESARTVSVMVQEYNSQFPVTFTRPKQISASLTVSIAIDGITTTNDIVEGLLKPVFESYFDTLEVGKSVSAASLNQLIYTTLAGASIETSNIGLITYTFVLDSIPTPMSGGHLPLEFDQYINLTYFTAAVT